MKRKFKAFTLIELIVVMAIMSILMVALMNFYKPIRETYVDSSMIEDMRTTQDGILEYLAENVKYAEKLMIFDDDSRYVSSYEYTDTTSPTGKSEKKINMPINSPKDAYDAFCIEYGLIKDDATATPDYNTMSGSEGKYIKSLEQIHIIVINRSALYDINGNVVSGADAAEKGYNGRVITNIIDKDKSAWNFYARDFGNAYGQRPAGNSTGTTYMALGGAYYGKSNYNIYINEDETIWSGSSSGSPSIT
ncbi:MAG: type II secretion system protein, partial [Oscillospiraceae bacterium]